MTSTLEEHFDSFKWWSRSICLLLQPVIDAIDSISVEYLATLDRMARVPPDEEDQLTTSYERLEALIDYNQVCLIIS